MVVGDIVVFDVNMGCFKSFFISGGMGLVFLDKLELIYDILIILRWNLNIFVMCKVRLFKICGEIVEFLCWIEKIGVFVLVVYGRRVVDRF